MDVKKSRKAVVDQKNANDEYVVVFIRGDLDVNETKVRNFVGEDIYPATITEESGIVAGFIGPKGIDDKATVLFDSSLIGLNDLVVGGNEVDYHYTGFSISRDYGKAEYHDFAKIMEGGICPVCGKPTIKISRGIEVGNIFQLGTKYTKTMKMQYTDADGNLQYPIMGCYGIGVGRLAASVCEAHHDDWGPIWPISIAPWQVHICCLRSDDEETRTVADKLYDELKADGLEVIYDDRKVRPGVMFSDADLLGVPVRVIVSPKNLANGECELVTRDKSVNVKVNVDDIKNEVHNLVNKLFEELNK